MNLSVLRGSSFSSSAKLIAPGKLAPPEVHLRTGVNMVPYPGFAPLVSSTIAGRSYRWFDRAISMDRAKMEVTISHQLSVNWGKLMGVAVSLVICGGSWTAAGIAATHLFR